MIGIIFKHTGSRCHGRVKKRAGEGESRRAQVLFSYYKYTNLCYLHINRLHVHMYGRHHHSTGTQPLQWRWGGTRLEPWYAFSFFIVLKFTRNASAATHHSSHTRQCQPRRWYFLLLNFYLFMALKKKLTTIYSYSPPYLGEIQAYLGEIQVAIFH